MSGVYDPLGESFRRAVNPPRYGCYGCGFGFDEAEPVRVEGSSGPYVSCPDCGRTLYLNDRRVRANNREQQAR